MNSDSDLICIEPVTKADACIIWLHGLGADGYDFEAVSSAMDLTDNYAFRFILPHAPVRSVTLNGGMQMRAWYDIYGIGKSYPEDEQGIANSHTRIADLIAGQIREGIPSTHIFLVGFSQGGSMALHTGLRFSEPLAGVACLSGYLSLRQALPEQIQRGQLQTPILMMHGSEDQVVDYALAEQSYKILSNHELNVSWLEYQHGHTVSLDQLADLSGFISRCLAD